jgi:hypothetical protein
MVENKLKRLIELNEDIVSQNKTLIAQNDKIIRLLTKLTGDNNNAININAVVGENGEVVIGENLTSPHKNDEASVKQKEIIEEKSEIANDNGTVLDLELVSGEVLFVSNSSDGEIDIYKLSVKSCDEFNVIPNEIQSEIEDEIGIVNNEITIENLTGNGMTSQFKVPLLVAFESFNQDLPIDSSTVILDDEIFDNLPEILRISIENGASKVYLSLKNAMAILNAPPMITNYLEFYKTREHILEKLNLNNE